MSNSAKHTAVPRATVHKRILDTAVDQPTASMAELAGQVPGANTDLVERVLDEYGDPAGDDGEQATESTDQPMAQKTIHTDGTESIGETTERVGASATTTTDDGPTDLEPFSEKERETLLAIRDHPEKSQRELAEVLGISGATVSNRVSGIEDFDWATRKEYVERLFGTAASPAENGTPSPAAEDGTRSPPVEDETRSPPVEDETRSPPVEDEPDPLAESVERLERQVGRLVEDDAGSALEDPELVHKVVHACVESEAISTDEELRILNDILG